MFTTVEDPRPSRLRDCYPDGQYNRALYNAFRERRYTEFPHSFFLLPFPASFPFSFPPSRIPFSFSPPLNFHRCFVRRDEEFQKRLRSLDATPVGSGPSQKRGPPTRRKTNKRRRETDVTNSVLWYKDEAGIAHRRDPRATDWYRDYVSEANTSATNFHKKFRARFRLPYAAFTSLIEECKRAQWFAKYDSRRARGLQQPHPIELYILGALRYIGRGWVFDDLEEATKISLSQHQRFLADFLEIGSTVWYDKWVRHPSTAEEANKHCHEYTMAGFPGCLGSTDATHVVHLGIPAWLREVHSSHKEGHPARTYNCTVNHRRMALFCTEGHPCTYNDKHLIKLDQFVNGMQVGKILSDRTFELYSWDEGNVIKQKWSGGYVLADNGYIPFWSSTVPPHVCSGSNKQ